MCLEPQRKKNRLVARIAYVGLATGLLAGCSSEVTRFAQGSIDRNPTGTTLLPDAAIGQSRGQSLYETNLIEAPRASAGQIISSPLPAPNPVYTAPSTPSPLMKSAAAVPSRTDMAAGIAARAPQVSPNWSAVGGTPIVVAKGDSLGAISARYGVPADVLLKTNGLTAAQIEPGMRLVVPVYNASATQAPVVKAEAPKLEAPKLEAPKLEAPKLEAPKLAAPKVETSKTANAKVIAPAPQVAQTGKTLAQSTQATKPADKTPAASAQANQLKPVEAKTTTQAVAANAKTATASSEKTAAQQPAKQEVASTKTAAVDRTPVATVTPANVKEEALSDSANPEFRWPARGRVIQGFKSGSNDGINISLPEGTPVKAAEAGVVVYAGNELKGYGNLVLIKHPNGFVSAYANNGDLDVKRGDSVKRGQTLAKSGQSGNVSSPQLHFELRKGSTPVDPTGFLAGL